MQPAQSNQVSEALSTEKIIDLIRSLRNDLIKQFLKDDSIDLYCAKFYEKKISHVKKEFLIRELKELLISPIDLVHYSKLITQIRETGVASLTLGNGDLFYKDLEGIFLKYFY